MEVIELLSYLIKQPTITPNECGIYKEIKKILKDFEVIEQNINGIKNLFLYKNFNPSKNNDSLIHFCFAGHIDVVPSGDGWSVDPFGAIIKNDVMYGRGVQDMKGGVASFVCALKNITNFDGILSLLLTSDEEGDGIYGTKVMLEELQKLDLLPHYALVAEPTCENILGDMIKIGRRGSINGILKIKGIQGHVAYPQKCKNPIDLIAPILPKLSSISLDDGDENFESSKIIITDIRAGMEVVNVTPSELKIMFNVRNNLLSNKESVKKYIDSICSHLDYELVLKQSSYPFLTDSCCLSKSLLNAIKTHTQIKPIFSTNGGTSDARYFSAFGVDVIEFGLVNDRIHGIDECVKIQDVIKLKDIFITTIENLNKRI